MYLNSTYQITELNHEACILLKFHKQGWIISTNPRKDLESLGSSVIETSNATMHK